MGKEKGIRQNIKLQKIKKRYLNRTSSFFEGENGQFAPLDFSKIEKAVEKILSNIQNKYMHGCMEIKCPRIFFDPSVKETNINEIKEHAYQLLIGYDSLMITDNIGNMKNLACININNNCKFYNDEQCYKTVKINLKEATEVNKYIKAFFIDMSFGNSEPLNIIIENYLQNNSIEDFFKLKKDFLKEKIDCCQTSSEESYYVNFAYECFSENNFDYENFINIWDEFILNKLNDNLLDTEELITYLNNNARHKKQISRRKIKNELAKLEQNQSPICVFLLPRKKPKSQDIDDAIRYNHKIKLKHWHSYVFSQTWEDFYNTKERLFINKNYLEPIKIYIRS